MTKLKTILSEDTTSNFVVSTKTKQLLPAGSFNSREYWMAGGKAEGKIDTEIEVFGNNHKAEAELLLKALKAAGLADRYFKITINVKSRRS